MINFTIVVHSAVLGSPGRLHVNHFLIDNLRSSLGLRGCFRGWKCGNKDTEVGCESA